MNVAEGVVKTVGAVAGAVDALHTSDDERNRHTENMAKIGQQADLANIETNKVEAAHRSVWVAGWRPGVGWACMTGVSWSFVLQPMVEWAVVASGVLTAAEAPPPLDTGPLIALLGIMLGNASLRTWEKMKGVAR